MYSIASVNPTYMYYSSLKELLKSGEEVKPRGKLIKELRPAAYEFENPYNRVTFLGNRRINPFFQIAESLWILSGRADVEWLLNFNANMKQFSDDGKYFNAPYGERMRSWNKNSLHNIVINPIDQLMDVYYKILNDKDTRQAVIVLSNPMFDNANYTIFQKGKDIACNLVLTFKVRNDKLNMTVFNRSNDIHWGVFGANLCQFSTIQEVLMNWLKRSGNPEFQNLEIGAYYHITDSLHVYLDDYGSKITNDVESYYAEKSEKDAMILFTSKVEPRMALSSDQFSTFLSTYWGVIDPYLMDDELILEDINRDEVFGKEGLVSDLHNRGVIDDYWYFGIQAMLAYRLTKLNKVEKALMIMKEMVSCQWKVSMLNFLKSFIVKTVGSEDELQYQKATNAYLENVRSLFDDLYFDSEREILIDYLKM